MSARDQSSDNRRLQSSGTRNRANCPNVWTPPSDRPEVPDMPGALERCPCMLDQLVRGRERRPRHDRRRRRGVRLGRSRSVAIYQGPPVESARAAVTLIPAASAAIPRAMMILRMWAIRDRRIGFSFPVAVIPWRGLLARIVWPIQPNVKYMLPSSPMTDPYIRTDTLGHRVRTLRRRRGISQAALGHPLSRSYISLIEHDRAVPSLRTLLAIAHRLGVEPCALLEAVNLDARAEYTPAHADGTRTIARPS
jgi:DNA-binding XRE family transcriptional regulator